MDNRNLEEVPPIMDPETIEREVISSNPMLTLITAGDGIPTSTEVTVLTTAFGDVPLMTTSLGTLADVPLGTTHQPTFVTSHAGGVSTVYTTSMTQAGQTVVVSDGDGRYTVVDSDGVRQAIVVHADPAQITSALAQVQVGGTGHDSGIVSFHQVPDSEMVEIGGQIGTPEDVMVTDAHQDHSSSVLESLEDVPTQIIEEGEVMVSEELVIEGTPSDTQLQAETAQPEVIDDNTLKTIGSQDATPAEDKPQREHLPSISLAVAIAETPSPPVPDEVVCLVCYQAFLNPNSKKTEESIKEEDRLKIVSESGESIEACKEITTYGRSLGRFFELSRVNMSIVTRRSYKDYEVPICQSCNEHLVQAESIIRDLRRLEKELFFLRGKIKDEIISSYRFFKNKDNKELAESRKGIPGLIEVLEIVDRVREDIINDGRPPKMSRLVGVPSRRGRKPKRAKVEAIEGKIPDSEIPKADMDKPINDESEKGIAETGLIATPNDDAEKVPSTIDNPVEPQSTTSDPPSNPSETTAIKPEAGKDDEEEMDVKPAIRTSFGRIVRRPAYMVNELTEDELSELGESSEDNYEDIEVKPDIPLDALDEGLDPLSALHQDEEEEEDPAWSPRKGLVISEKVGIPTSSSEESEVLTDYDSDMEAIPKVKVKRKKLPRERKAKRAKKTQNKKRKIMQPAIKPEHVNYEVKVIQLDGTELMTINTTGPDDNIGLEPEITQKVMDSQAVIMVKNQLFGKRVQCPHCPRSFTDPTRRDVHVKKKHEGDTKPFGCEVCQKRFGRQDHLRNHMKRHTRPPKDKTTRIKPSTGQKNHTCPYCDQRFRNKSELSIHTRLHTGERPYKCDHCEEGFVSALKREFHVEQMHPEIPPIRCEFCPRGFFRQHRLRIHALGHTGEKTNICEVCGKCFSQAAMLRYHQTTHEELNLKQFKCHECGRVFANPQNLKSHMESQHQKMYRHRCDTCGRGYTQMSHLRRHLRTHSGEQPFVCSYCPKKFTSGAALKIHVRIHTGERPYWCAQCEKGFRSKTKLGRHMKTLIHVGDANKMKRDVNLTEIETMEVGDDVNAGSSATWTEIVGIISGV